MDFSRLKLFDKGENETRRKKTVVAGEREMRWVPESRWDDANVYCS